MGDVRGEPSLAGHRVAHPPGTAFERLADRISVQNLGKGGDAAAILSAERFRYLNLQFEDDVLVGATSLGLTQHVGVLRGLIQSRTRLGAWKAKLKQDPTRIMEAYLACAQGQSAPAHLKS